MRKSRFTEAQIISVLKQAEQGRQVSDLAREHGITSATFYRWRSQYGGMEVSQAQELNRVLEENRRLKHLVADLTLDNQALKLVLGKK
jgi:putative transposase